MGKPALHGRFPILYVTTPVAGCAEQGAGPGGLLGSGVYLVEEPDVSVQGWAVEGKRPFSTHKKTRRPSR